MAANYHTYCTALADIPKPCIYLDLDLLDLNITQVLARSGHQPVRIATKSIRSVSALKYIAKKSARFIGFMAYSAREAAWLLEQDLDDILIGYPDMQAADVDKLAALVKQGKTVYWMVDKPEHVHQLILWGQKFSIVWNVCMDVDMSTSFPGIYFGVYRSAIHTPEQALALFQIMQSSTHVQLKGVMGYEAQVAGVGDAEKGQFLKNKVVQWLKGRSIADFSKRRQAIVRALQDAGASITLVNAGGTGSLESSAAEHGVTEVTAGSAFYAPALFDAYQQFKHAPAMGFALQITREPKPNIFTCSGGGYVASGAAGKAKLPVPFLPSGMSLFTNEGTGEVQTPVAYHGSETLGIGSTVFFRHAKAGELCEHFNQIHLIRQGSYAGNWLTYRGEGVDFLG